MLIFAMKKVLIVFMLVLVASNIASFSLGQTLYGTRLAAYGYLAFTNEVSIRGIDVINETCVVVVVQKTSQTVLGKKYVVSVGVEGLVSQVTVSWSQDDPDEKKLNVIFPQSLPGNIKMIRVKISS